MDKTTKIVIWVIIIALVIWGISSFQKKASVIPPGGEPVKIGVASLLSGDGAAIGENIVNATRLAVDEVNKNGGVNGKMMELVVEDAKCDSATGLSAVQKLVNVDEVKYIVGGMCSNGTLAAAPLANQNKILIMTPVTGGKNIDEAGEYVFRNANSDILAGRDIADAMIKLGYKNVGVVAETTEYTLDIKKTFEETIRSKGGTVVVSEDFQSDTKDYRTMVAKVKAKNPQALLVLSQLGTNAAYFIKQAHEIGFNPPIFTDFTFATNDSAKKIVGSFDGIYFADPAYDADNQKTKDFLSLYRQTYNIAPVIPFHAAASYDVVMMYADAIRSVGDNPEKVKDWLLGNVKNRVGLMGTFSFDKNGNSDLGFLIKIIKNGEPVKLEE